MSFISNSESVNFLESQIGGFLVASGWVLQIVHPKTNVAKLALAINLGRQSIQKEMSHIMLGPF